MGAFGFSARYAATLLRRRAWTGALAIVLTALALGLPLFVALMAYGVDGAASRARLAPEAVVFIARGTGSEEIKAVQGRAQQLPGVVAVEWMSRDAAWSALGARSALGNAGGRSNPLPDVLIVRTAFGTPMPVLEQLAAQLAKLPRADAVQADWDWYRRLDAWRNLARPIVYFFALTATVTVLLVLIGAVRLMAAAQPAELRLLRALGAAPGTLRRPFALVGALILTAGSALGLAAATAGWWWVRPHALSLAQTYGLPWNATLPEPSLAAAVLIVSGLIGAAVGAASGLEQNR